MRYRYYVYVYVYVYVYGGVTFWDSAPPVMAQLEPQIRTIL